MKKPLRVFEIAVIYLLLNSPLLAQQPSYTISHWADGSSMDCTYIFEPMSVVSWVGNGAPPVTVENVNNIVSDWADSRNLSLVTISSYRLALTYDYRITSRRRPVRAWFIDLIAIPNNRGRVNGLDAQRKLAISLNGSVIEPTCN